MRKIFYSLAALSAVMMVSCNKEASPIETPSQEAEKVQVVLPIATRGLATRADGDQHDIAAERKLNSVDVFFFRADGTLDAQYSFSGTEITNDASTPFATNENAMVLGYNAQQTSAKKMWVSNAVLDVYAVANAPADVKNTVTSFATFKTCVSQFTQNTIDGVDNGNFVMVGRLTAQNIATIAEDATHKVKCLKTMELERIANKVLLKKLTKNFTSPAYQNAKVTLEGAWIVNAPKAVNYAAIFPTQAGARVPDALLFGQYLGSVKTNYPTSAEGDALYHNPTFTAASGWEANNLITNVPVSGIEITAAGTAFDNTPVAQPQGFAFYFYPNPAIESDDITVEDYVTKLTLKVKVAVDGGETHTYWYPIAINQAKRHTNDLYVAAPDATAKQRNLIYVIDNLTLKMAGNKADGTPEDDDPNKYIDNSIVDLHITVLDWVTGEIVGSYNDRGWGDLNL